MNRLLSWMCAMILTCMTGRLAEAQHYEYQTRLLDNGLRVVTLEDFACPVVAVQVWYRVGAVNEDPQRQGFAHLFEHMMFRGTDRLGPKDHFELVHRSGGDCNGYTSFDRTVYVNRVPANQLELALWLEAERMALLAINEEGFATERQVVEEERRLSLNRPYGTVYEKVLPAVFPVHPYRWTPIGQIPHLRAATIAEVRSFWQRYYAPNNATVLVVGAIRHDEANRLVEQYLGWIPRRPDPPAVSPPPASQPAQAPVGELVIDEPRGPVPMVGLACPTVPVSHPDRLPLQFLAQVLGDGHSSRLYKDLVRRRKLAVEVDADSSAWEHGGMFFARAMLAAGSDPRKVREALGEHLARLAAEPPTRDEWTKAHNQLLRNEVTRAMTVAGKANVLGHYAVTLNDLERVNRRLDEIRAVTGEDIQRAARRYLAPERLTAVIVQPAPNRPPTTQEDRPGAATGPAAAGSPAGQPPRRPAAFPKDPPVQPLLDSIPRVPRQTTALPNGLRVVVVPDRRVPFLRMTLGLKFGAWSEDPGRPGSAWLACRMLTRGTTGYSAEQLAEELELHAISLEGDATMDVAAVHADCLAEHADRAARLLAEVVLRPTFAQGEFDLLREQTLSNLLIKAQTPAYLVEREFRTRLFASHPYSRTPTGEPEDVKRLTPADLAGWWKQFARPDAAVLYLAGDIEPKAGFALAEKWLGTWQGQGPRPEPKVPEAPAPADSRIYLVNKPGSVQSEIYLGHLGITRAHPDYFRTRVLTQIFGGSFNSRLNQSLRIDKGLTYAIGGSFVPERFSGTFRVRTFTKTARTAEAVRAILDEIRAFQAGQPTAEEMAVARSYLVGSFAGARETPQATVNDLWLIEYAGLPAEYLDLYLNGIRNADEAGVARVARELIHSDKLTIAVVGDAEAIKADLEKIAPVTVVGE